MTNYWIKDESRKQIITKTQILNNGNFELFASYFNLMDAKGLSFHLTEDIEIESEKLFSKNEFEYLILQHDNFKEFIVLPNENLEILTEKIISKISICSKNINVIDLVLKEMN
jgi:hypothetical protein